MNVSGLYERQDNNDTPFTRETLRLDVDATFPQMAASGTGLAGLQFRTHWVARPLTRVTTPNGEEWGGPIVHKFGTVNLLPHDIVVLRFEGGQLRATFRRSGFPDRVRDFAFQSPHFREVTLEYDAEQGVELVLDHQTHSHPDRPATLANEALTIDTVYERAGFRVLRTGQDGNVPRSGSGADERWSNNEMHDAMQVHFSRLASLPPSQRNQARWALWTFFAGIHEDGSGLGGIMFDSIGSAERQGTALFLRSFISEAPDGDATPEAWRRRMAFWTAVHEMGHAFNLLHAWDKGVEEFHYRPWVPQTANYDLLTFMNYPYLYQTGSELDANTIRFFREFSFRFTDSELLFLRHAPKRFVIMGGERFGTNHAFEQARLSPAPALTLEARVNRNNPEFEFMEPIVIELKLKNTSKQPALVPDRLLHVSDSLTIQVQKRWGEPKTFHPFAHYCYQGSQRVLDAGESIYESLFLSVDQNEWLIDSPGYYAIQVCLHFPNEDILSNSLPIRVAPPQSRDEEYVAQDYFSEDVGRAITFDGTQVLTKANDALREVATRFPKSNAATHAQVSLDLPRTISYKLLDATDAPRGARYAIREIEPATAETQSLSKMLGDPKTSDKVAAILGHIDFRYYAERCSQALRNQDRVDEAREVCQSMHDTLKDRGVAPHVLEEIAETMKGDPEAAKKPRKRKSK
jgi:hypothetical protein